MVGVAPNSARLDAMGALQELAHIGGDDSGSKAIHGIVGLCNSIVKVLELDHSLDGAKDLLVMDAVALLDVGEDGGLDEETLATLADASNAELSLLLTKLNVLHDTVELLLRDLSTLCSVRLEWISSDLDTSLGLGHCLLHELVTAKQK